MKIFNGAKEPISPVLSLERSTMEAYIFSNLTLLFGSLLRYPQASLTIPLRHLLQGTLSKAAM